MVADPSVYFLEYILITFRFPAVVDCFFTTDNLHMLT